MKKGFTLVELLAVIAILSVLAIIVVPNVINNYKKALIKKMVIEENNAADAAQIYVEEHCIDPLYYKGEIYTCPDTYTTDEYVCLNELQDPGHGNAPEDQYIGDIKYSGENCYGLVKFDGTSKNTYLFCGTGGNFSYTTDSSKYYDYQGECGITGEQTTSISSENLVLHYDGSKNTGTVHNGSSTTWKNLAGTSYNGTLNGGTWGSNYLYLDGVDDWVSIGQFNYQNFTVETVIEVSSQQPVIGYFIGNVQAGGFGMGVSASLKYRTLIYITKNAAYTDISSTQSFTLNQRYTVALTYDGNAMKQYIDGGLVLSNSESGTVGTPALNTITVLGANPNGSGVEGNYFNGKIYSVRVYNKALSNSEILNNYQHDQAYYNN